MRYRDKHKKTSTATTRIVCSLCFIAFCFLWLFFFQADVLTVAQHELSGGQTHYDRTIGSVLITAILQLLQIGVYAITRLSRRTHALTYLPSFLLLAILSSLTSQPTSSLSHLHYWVWLAPLVLAVWCVCVWLARQLLPFDNDVKTATGLFSQRTWLNLLQMAAMMLAVAAIGNTNAVYHFKAHAETSLMRGDTAEALQAGVRSHESDPSLTMLRAYALSCRHELGQKLFTYPVKGSSDNLLPNKSRLLILPADTIWKHLGGRPLYKLSAMRFYEALEHDSLATEAVADYVLCSLLIDRDLVAFHKKLFQYFGTSPIDSLPQHYKEALVLFQQRHSDKTIIFPDQKTEDRWEAMEQMKSQYTDPEVRRLKLYENYRDTYWYYYDYGAQ